ncbi:zinc finger nfx1-type containing [Anaeramoeba flamelloides]|uniref:Zinc finger nfx1-type containing n=1 Tax=Anaeramoeba flamelloides TaxID=1746091 RepID=A0ABQ8YXD0_9EUKA|nr:zinc finger nfx1-type containing [Anaeramoeba flamelloides]
MYRSVQQLWKQDKVDFELTKQMIVGIYRQTCLSGVNFSENYIQKHSKSIQNIKLLKMPSRCGNYLTEDLPNLKIYELYESTLNINTLTDQNKQRIEDEKSLQNFGLITGSIDRFVEELSNTEILIDFLIPEFCTRFRSSPWIPLLHLILVLFNYSFYQQAKVFKYLHRVIEYQSSKQLLIESILGHLNELSETLTNEQRRSSSIFLGYCFSRFDKHWLPPCFLKSLGPCLPLSLIEGKEKCSNTEATELFLKVYLEKDKQLSLETANNRFFINFFLDPLIYFSSKFNKNKKEKVKQNENENENENEKEKEKGFENEQEILINNQATIDECFTLSCILSGLLDILDQPIIGKYIALFLIFWCPIKQFDEIKQSQQQELPKLWIIDYLYTYLQKAPIYYKRRLKSQAVLLELNILCHYTNNHGAITGKQLQIVLKSLDKRIDLTKKRLFRLFCLKSEFPDHFYIRDLLFGNFFIPRLSISFLDSSQYLVRNFILFKCNTAFDIWQEFLQSKSKRPITDLNFFTDNSKKNHYKLRFRTNKPIFYLQKSQNQETNFVFLINFDENNGTVSFFVGARLLNSFKKKINPKKKDQNSKNYKNSNNGKSNKEDKGKNEESGGTMNKQTYYWEHIIIFDENYSEMINREQRFPELTHILPLSPTLISYTKLLNELTQMLELTNPFEVTVNKLILGGFSSNEETIKEQSKMQNNKFQQVINFNGVISNLNEFLSLLKIELKNNLYQIILNNNFESEIEFKIEKEIEVQSTNESQNTNENKNEKESTIKFIDNCLIKWGARKENDYKCYFNQQRAIFSSLLKKVLLVVGPPGTGKTFTIEKIINLHKNNQKKILIITHSNLALDSILNKLVVNNNIDTDSAFRLGSQSKLKNAEGFLFKSHLELKLQHFDTILNNLDKCNKPIKTIPDKLKDNNNRNDTNNNRNRNRNRNQNRINWKKRIRIIQEFFELVLNPTIKQYDINKKNNNITLEENLNYFSNQLGIPTEFISCQNHIDNLIIDLEYLLKICNFFQLNNYYKRLQLAKETKLIFATISGISIYYPMLKNISFDLMIIEEASKILETEMILPLSLKPKAIVFVGDHKQLSPIVKKEDMRGYATYNRSIFERFLRVGCKPIVLNIQGRAIPQICDIYRWRYNKEILLDFNKNESNDKFSFLKNRIQFVNITNSKSRMGETNLIEAEWIISFVKYLLLYNVNPNEITILTPYKKQKAFIISLFQKQFKLNQELIPSQICTADEYQGLENEIILISLVATGQRPSWFLQNSNRITVLTSRAKKALFIFGKYSTFKKSQQWEKIYQIIKTKNSSKFLKLLNFKTQSFIDINQYKKFQLVFPSNNNSNGNNNNNLNGLINNIQNIQIKK